MIIRTMLPLNEEGTVKDLIFTILTKEHPLKIIELTNLIRKRYGKSVTFQAVRKALLQLVEEGVLVKEKNVFLISKDWIKESKMVIDDLYLDLYEERKPKAKTESIGGEVSVFTFNSLNDMMKFWQELIDDWFKKFKKGDPSINVYQAAHVWEGLLHLDRERILMGQLKKKGILSYILSTGNTPLDRSIKKFYTNSSVKFYMSHSTSSFDKAYYVGTYGDMIIQSSYPDKLVKQLDVFFKKNRTIEDFDLRELSDIVNQKAIVKLTVIKNLEMAKQINKSVLSQIE